MDSQTRGESVAAGLAGRERKPSPRQKCEHRRLGEKYVCLGGSQRVDGRV